MKKNILVTLVLVIAFTMNVLAVKPEKGKVNDITQSEFTTYISEFKNGVKSWKYKGKRPAVIDFYAVWCGPCRKISPIMDELAKEYSGKIDFYKVDVDKAPQLSQAYGISSIPMILFVPVDNNPQALMGLYPKEDLVKIIKELLVGKK